jgi:hypothetical protein
MSLTSKSLSAIRWLLKAGTTDTAMAQEVINGAACVRQMATEVAFPQEYYLPFTGTATTQTSATITTLAGVSMYNTFAFEVTSISGTTPAVKVYPSYDGTNYSATALALTDLSSGTLGTAIAGGTGATAVGNYQVAITQKVNSLRFDYTAAVAGSVAIRGGCGVI